jgi:hypothetical protein
MRTHWMILLVLIPAAAQGQVVFFDDFQGPELAPHWSAPPPEHWDYNFNNGMMNVTGLHYPSIPHSSSNWASMAAHFAPQTDFRADVWMGWGAGQPYHRLTVSLVDPQAHNLANFTYTDEPNWGPGPMLFAGTGNQSFSALAPPPGIHHFSIIRTGLQFDFLVNGAPFASFPDQFGRSLTTVFFHFTRSYPGMFTPLYVDRVVVVPAPGMGTVAALSLLTAGNRSRRQQRFRGSR